MIEINGTYNSAIVYADTIDSGAEGLIKAFCNSPVSDDSKIRIMPDVSLFSSRSGALKNSTAPIIITGIKSTPINSHAPK